MDLSTKTKIDNWFEICNKEIKMGHYDIDVNCRVCGDYIFSHMPDEDPKQEDICSKKCRDAEALSDLLSLVMDPYPEPNWIVTLGRDDLDRIRDWAGREHLAASDNTILRINMPGILQLWTLKQHQTEQQESKNEIERITQEEYECGTGAVTTKTEEFKMPNVVAVDFDGVIHRYDGWKGEETINEKIVGGEGGHSIRKELKKLKENGWKIIIWTSRSKLTLVKYFLSKFGIPYDSINHNEWAPKNLTKCRKIVANAYIDDRAIPFSGSWDGMADKVMSLKPWYEKEKENEQMNAIDPKRKHLPLNLFGYYADQISFYVPDALDAAGQYIDRGITSADSWIFDKVMAVSTGNDKRKELEVFEVQLAFNYDIMPVEFELISVNEGKTVQIPDWDDRFFTCGLSHIGFHVDNLYNAIRKFEEEGGCPLFTIIHTCRHSHCPHLYDYAFMDTRKFGFIAKLIIRKE